jgi:uncharacterized membrane protein
MTKTRLEAFSDGVIAIIITIMVLELKIPHEATLHALGELAPVFVSYLVSFVFVGIYWANHHHLLHTLHKVNSKVIWANMVLLFFLSLIPFSTGFIGETRFDSIPVATYCVNLLLCAIAYTILQNCIMSSSPHSSMLSLALKKQGRKGAVSLVIYLASVVCAFFYPYVSCVLVVLTAIMWVVPDKNIEQALKEH